MKELPENTPAEVRVLAREMACARERMVRYFEKNENMSFSAAVAHLKETNSEDWRDRIKQMHPEQVSWFGLDSLSDEGEHDAALAIWNNIKRAAIDEFETGSRALRVIDLHPEPHDKARFLALRESFREEWQPRGGSELVLIDTLAQTQMMYEQWLTRHMQRMSSECFRDWKAQELADQRHEWIPPRQSEAEATREAFEMAEKFQRMFLRTLRALRDLRRYTPAVVIQNAGQVNVGQQQINLASS